MNKYDIMCIVKGHELLRNSVIGASSPDTLPQRVQVYPSAYVCYTDPLHLLMTHGIVTWKKIIQREIFGRLPVRYNVRIKIFYNKNLGISRVIL